MSAISLRDKMAAKAMSALLDHYLGGAVTYRECAENAYMVADAMLAARESTDTKSVDSEMVSTAVAIDVGIYEDNLIIVVNDGSGKASASLKKEEAASLIEGLTKAFNEMDSV